jgi:hypothetical protein
MKRWQLFLFLIITNIVAAQQDQLLFHTHYLGESNFLNPAVQSECKWFVGIPVLSSVHLNYANSGFTYNQLLKDQGDGTYDVNIDGVVDRLGRRTLIGTELHTSLLALGYKRDDYYIAFSIIEKNNIPFTFPADMFMLIWNGNSSFEGESASLRGTAAYVTHYREYALGISKHKGYGNFVGLKGKLLFGKLNLAVPRSRVDLYTDENNFDLRLHGDLRVNSSAPLIIEHTDGRIRNIAYDENVSLRNLLFNRKNWGIAFDAGFIQRIDERTTVSGSILDVGFIRWRSNLNTISAEEDIIYRGVLADTGRVIESVLDSIPFAVSHDPYFTFLPLKTYLGINYELAEKLDVRALGSAVIYKTKFTPAFTLSLDYNPFGFLHLLGSYSLFYGAYNNFGAGFSIGRGPVQFYILSDNALGMIDPANARNLNLRFGLNMNFGCNTKRKVPDEYKTLYGPCHTYDDVLIPKKRVRRNRH